MATQTANQFIGSKISLISKSEIRYEGILYSLDLQDATISLAKVKSFGTEDRPTERPVPLKEEIYEFIIFRGSDIKGIDVLEPPKAAPTSALHNDPAIVEVSHYHSAGQPGQAPQQPTAAAGYAGPFGASMLGASSSTSSKLPHHNQGHSFLDFVARSNASTPSLFSNRKSPVNDTGVQADDRGRNNRQYNNNRQIDGRGSRHSSEDRRRQNRQPQQGGPADRQIGYQPRGRGNYVNHRGGAGGNFRGGFGQRGTRGGYRQGIIKAQMPPKVTFEEAFDFDKANEELLSHFSKIKLKSEDGDKKGDQDGGDANAESDEQENKEPAEPFYVKDSFYDKISCEATERSKGKSTRPDWRAERKLNAETFGVPVNNGQRRGGGGFRGGFRGNYRDSNFRGGNYGGNRGYQQRGNYGQNYSYGGSGGGGGYYQYNRYNGGRGNRGGNRSQQQQQQTQNQQQAATAATQ